MSDVLDLTKTLIRYETVNPPGDESDLATFLAKRLQDNGLNTRLQTFGPDRMNVIADLEGEDNSLAPLVFTGHMDTVPLGDADWSTPPFDAQVANGKLFGRGTSDMKSGIAAMAMAVCDSISRHGRRPRRRLIFLLTGGEETGCHGALHFVSSNERPWPAQSAIVVGEPTSNRVALAHKGALFLEGCVAGVTAHSSMPEKGENAIYKAARAIGQLEKYPLSAEPDPILGEVTLNVGMISGGLNINSVPDFARFTIDIRSNGRATHSALLNQLQSELGSHVEINTLADLPAVKSSADDPFVQMVEEVVSRSTGLRSDASHLALPFFTDASVLQGEHQFPTVILGPGEPEQAHQTDEFCFVDKIYESQSIYSEIFERWCY